MIFCQYEIYSVLAVGYFFLHTTIQTLFQFKHIKMAKGSLWKIFELEFFFLAIIKLEFMNKIFRK